MVKTNLAVEIVGVPIKISNAQADKFARQTYSAIRDYCEENHEAFLAWEREQNGEINKAVVR